MYVEVNKELKQLTVSFTHLYRAVVIQKLCGFSSNRRHVALHLISAHIIRVIQG